MLRCLPQAVNVNCAAVRHTGSTSARRYRSAPTTRTRQRTSASSAGAHTLNKHVQPHLPFLFFPPFFFFHTCLRSINPPPPLAQFHHPLVRPMHTAFVVRTQYLYYPPLPNHIILSSVRCTRLSLCARSLYTIHTHRPTTNLARMHPSLKAPETVEMSDATAALHNLELNDERFVGLLRNLIGEVEHLQNTGVGTAYVPQEDLAIKHVLEVLAPHRKEHGGPLEIDHVTYAEGRGNLIIKYPGTGSDEDVLSFVGSHLDVVPANADAWEVDPFSLTVEGDKLFGRGTTDCLGHVALMTTLFSQLAELKPNLKTSLTCVFIASEEASGPGIGVDGLVAEGRLDHCKPGPVVWVDCADSQPCIGTAGAITWHLTATGHRFHSGLPHKGINAIELGMEASSRIQSKFYEDFPACEKEREYKFITPSTMKPTQVKCAPGGLNQIPPEATISGDIRLTPFYDVDKLKASIEAEVAAINADIEALPTRGPCSKYVITPDGGEPIVGRVSLEWGDHLLTGIACNLESPAFKLMCDAIGEVKGKAEPYSLTGSLPLVHEMQSEGFDIQLIGFGLMSTYHADNEYCSLSDMKDAAKILSRLIAKFG